MGNDGAALEASPLHTPRRVSCEESAFEAYLQWHRLCYVAVDVKGRRFPAGPENRPRRVWECWSVREDLISLGRWAEVFGPGFRGLLVFAYHVLPSVELPDDVPDLWNWRGRRYLLRAVAADDYRRHMKVRSPKWDTVTLPNAVFRELVRPFSHFVGTGTMSEV